MPLSTNVTARFRRALERIAAEPTFHGSAAQRKARLAAALAQRIRCAETTSIAGGTDLLADLVLRHFDDLLQARDVMISELNDEIRKIS